jgi:hypothetical protein
MDVTSTPRLAHPDATGAVPACPRCRTTMILRAGRRQNEVADLYWGCARSPACAGRRRVEAPQVLRPAAADASVQAVFEWERAREQALANRRHGLSSVLGAGGRLLSTGGRLLAAGGRALPGRCNGLADRRDRRAAAASSTRALPPKPVATMLAGLIEHGYVILDDRRLSFARARLDYVVVGPTGLFVIESRPWPGQLGISNDELFVDGRRRSGATDQVARATAAVEQTLAHELKPLGAPVRPVLCVERATPQWFNGTVQGVMVTNGRSLPRSIREGEATLGPETVVRVALAADRLLE